MLPVISASLNAGIDLRSLLAILSAVRGCDDRINLMTSFEISSLKASSLSSTAYCTILSMGQVTITSGGTGLRLLPVVLSVLIEDKRAERVGLLAQKDFITSPLVQAVITPSSFFKPNAIVKFLYSSSCEREPAREPEDNDGVEENDLGRIDDGLIRDTAEVGKLVAEAAGIVEDAAGVKDEEGKMGEVMGGVRVLVVNEAIF